MKDYPALCQALGERLAALAVADRFNVKAAGVHHLLELFDVVEKASHEPSSIRSIAYTFSHVEETQDIHGNSVAVVHSNPKLEITFSD